MNHRDFVDAFDLEGYLQRYPPLATKPDELVITCPTCGKQKLTVNTSKRTWHCWVCEEYKMNLYGKRKPVAGAGGLLDLIQLLEGCARDRAVAIVSDQSKHLSVPINFLESRLQPVLAHAPVREGIVFPPGWKPITDYGLLPYLAQRGIMPDDVQAYGLGYCDSGLYAGRLVFPVWEDKRLVYYQARAMWESNEPGFRKSLNPPKQEGLAGPAEVLMNIDMAKRYQRVALVEGPIDCVHAGPSACATFGKKVSMAQALKLKHAGVSAVDLMWDGPSENEPLGAWPEMMKAGNLLSGMFEVRLVFLPQGDPGEYTRAELDSFRARGVPASAVSRLAMV